MKILNKQSYIKGAIKALFFAASFSFVAVNASAQFTLSVGLSIRTAPPSMPVYSQPPCPVDGYLWTPGYWAYDDIDGYYWVPGVWLMPPMTGHYWTPGYWSYSSGIYGWRPGYWGLHIGYYGGVNYGYGYGGVGFVGGEWRGRVFNYNTAVVNVNTTVVHNTYINKTVINNTTINNRSSFNGAGGTNAQPNRQEQAASHENHIQPTSQQVSHNQTASHDRNQFASVNSGHPTTTAMNKVGGQRFNQQGHDAPKPVERPAAGIKASNQPANTNTNHPAVPNNSSHPAAPAANINHPATPNTNHPVMPNQNHPVPNTNHPVAPPPANNHPAPVTNHPVMPNQNHPVPNNNHPAMPQNNHPAAPKPNNNHPAPPPVHNQPAEKNPPHQKNPVE